MMPHEQNGGDVKFSSVVFFYVGVDGCCRRPLDGILFIRETPQQLRGFENVTRAYVDIVSSTWVKLRFSVNYPF